MIKVVKNTLPRFLEKLKNISTETTQLIDKVAQIIAEKVKEFADNHYAGTSFIVKVEMQKGKIILSASGKGISFDEFGVGTLGEASGYDELLLPTQLIEFESPKGKSRQTQGWVYNYRIKLYPEDNSKTIVGRVAGKRMWKTEQDVINFIKTELKKYIVKEK